MNQSCKGLEEKLTVQDGLMIMDRIPNIKAKDIKVGQAMKAIPQILDDGRATIMFEAV